MFSRFSSVPIKNTGSVARDLLAAERTFLAWARTGLGFIALGVALEKVEAFAAISPTLFHLKDSKTKVAAGVLVASGSVCVLHGSNRYFTTLNDIKAGLFRPNRAGVIGLASACIGIAVAGAALVVQNSVEGSDIETLDNLPIPGVVAYTDSTPKSRNGPGRA